VLEADIKVCYDEISHPCMVANIPTDKVILQKWLKAGYVYQDELFPTDAGVPQGGIISPVTAPGYPATSVLTSATIGFGPPDVDWTFGPQHTSPHWRKGSL
jgi:hypothetical protein